MRWAAWGVASLPKGASKRVLIVGTTLTHAGFSQHPHDAVGIKMSPLSSFTGL